MATQINLTTGTLTTAIELSVGARGPAGTSHDPATVSGNGISISGQQISLSIGTGSTQVAAGNDSRFTDARTPTAHKTSHATGGSDAITPADIGAADTGIAGRQDLGLSRAKESGALTTLAAISFNRVKAERQINPIPDEFVFWDTKFETSLGLTLGTGATVTPGTGLALTKNGVDANAFCVVNANKIVGPCVAVELSTTAVGPSGAVQYIAAGITLRSAAYATNYICAFWNKAAGTVGVDVIKNGVQTATSGSAFAPTGSFKLLALIYGNTVSVMADTGGGWYNVHTFKEVLAATWNLRTDWDSNDFAPMCFAFATSGAWSVSRFRAGYAGYVGLQSLCHAKYEDGTPITNERGEYYMHATACLPYNETSTIANYWKHAHGMTFTVDPNTYRATPSAMYFPYRDGEHRPDDAFGPLLYDRDAKQWNWLTQNASQIGAVNAKILNYYTSANMLHGVHRLSDNHEITVSGNTKPKWDADIVKISGTWYMCYAERTHDLLAGSFFPSLASSSSLTTPFTFIANDNTQTVSEGMHFGKIGGTWYVLSSNDGGLTAYDFSMVLQRTITPTGFTVGYVPHPHFNLIAINVGKNTKYVIETFDRSVGIGSGTGTYGTREIYESPIYAGNEFDVDRVSHN